jgi:hypothetical protein
MSKKQLIIGVVAALGATATAFSLWKLYKTERDMYERQRAQDRQDTEDMIKEEIAQAFNAYDETHKDENEEPDFIQDPDELLQNEPDLKERSKTEVNILRFDKNSYEAMGQYKQFRLANFNRNGQLHKLMMRLFDIDLVLNGDSDHSDDLPDKIDEARINFFGVESKFIGQRSVAELILYFAERATFDFNKGPDYWASLWLRHYFNLNSELISQGGLESFAADLGHMKLYNTGKVEDLYGLFSLRDRDIKDDSGDIMQEFWEWETYYMNEVLDEPLEDTEDDEEDFGPDD